MDDFLPSARAKLGRATEHLEALKAEMDAYGDGHLHELQVESNADATQYAFRLRVREEPPFLRWSLLVGDCLNNLRAALDHAIYGLASVYSRQLPPPKARDLAFPITNGPTHFANSLKLLGDLAADGDIRALVEGLQPYNRLNTPHLPALQLLRELNDTDKHRIIHVTRGVNLGMTMPEMTGLPPGSAMEIKVWTSGSLEDGTEIVKFSFDIPAPDLKVNGPFNLEIYPAISHAPTDDGRTHSAVDWLLQYIRNEVGYCLDQFAAFI